MLQSPSVRLVLGLFVIPLAALPPAAAEVEVRLVSGLPFAAGEMPNGDSEPVAASADGQWLLLETTANNLAGNPPDGNRGRDLHLYELATGESQLVTRAGAAPWAANDSGSIADNHGVAISADGRYVAYESSLRSLVPGVSFPDFSRPLQVYLFDRLAGVSTLVSHHQGNPLDAADTAARFAGMSADGRYLIFNCADNLLTSSLGPDGNYAYLFDRTTGAIRLVSHLPGQPTARPNDDVAAAAISADGRFVLLQSAATDLVTGITDTANTQDAFVWDRQADSIELISRDAANPSTAVGATARKLSADGRYVLLDSRNVLLGAGLTDGNGTGTDVFRFDRQTATAVLISASAAAPAQSGNRASTGYAMSDDGQVIYFTSLASTLIPSFVDGNSTNVGDLFVFDGVANPLALISHAAGAASTSGNGASTATSTGQPAISSDGRYALFFTAATNLDAGVTDTNGQLDLYRFDRQAGASLLVSRLGASNVAGGASSRNAVLTGSSAALWSSRAEHQPGVANPWQQAGVFRYQPGSGEVALLTLTGQTGRTTLPSSTGTGPAAYLEAGGRFVLWDAYLWDRLLGVLERVGHAAGSPASPANGDVVASRTTPDGRFVLLTTQATNLAAGVTDANGIRSDVFLYDRNVDGAFLMSFAAGMPTTTSSGTSEGKWMSDDARYLVIRSTSNNYCPGVTSGGNAQLYLFDRGTGACELLTPSHLSPTQGAEDFSDFHAIGPALGWLVHENDAADLVPGFVDHNNQFVDPLAGDPLAVTGIEVPYPDLYYYDRAGHQTFLVSRRAGTENEGSSGILEGPAVAPADGSSVYFTSSGPDLVAGQLPTPGGNAYKAFRWDRTTRSNEVLFHEVGNPLQPCGPSSVAAVTPNGRWVLGTTTCSYAAGDTGSQDAYLIDRLDGSYTLISHAPGQPTVAAGGRAVAISDDGRRVVYNGPDAPYSYDRLTQQRTRLAAAYYDPGAPAQGNAVAASRDGNHVLLTTYLGELAPFDGNSLLDHFFVTLGDLFADGFESGSTAAWSQTLP